MSSGRRSIRSPGGGGGETPSKDKGKKKITELEVVGGKLSARGQLHIVMEQVYKLLSVKNREAFKHTSFGHLLNMTDIQPQMQLIFLLLYSLDEGSESRNVLSFIINDSIVEFGLHEFFCISGLSFKELVQLPRSSYMHGHIFRERADLTAGDVYAAFIHYSKKHKGGGSHVLKLALLHVLYSLLLNRDKKWKKIELDFMHLVDDIEAFNRYPWGRVAFDFLVHWTYRARDNVNRLGVQSDRPSTDVCGFYLTLQIFSFEIMPLLARHCARKIDGATFPRIRRWTASAYFKYTILLEYFKSSDVNSIMQFQFSDDERGRFIEAGLIEDVGINIQPDAHGSQSKKSTRYKLVDEDDDHEGEGALEEKGVNEFAESGKSKGDDVLDDGGKWNGSDEVCEVQGDKVKHLSTAWSSRRQRAAHIGRLLKAQSVPVSTSRGTEASNEVSLEKLADVMEAMKVRMQADSDAIFKISDMIKGMNSLLETVLDRVSAVESSMNELKRTNEAVGSVDGVEADSVERQEASHGVGEQAGGPNSVDPMQEEVIAEVGVEVEVAKAMDKVCTQIGEDLRDSVGILAGEESRLDVGQQVHEGEGSHGEESNKYAADPVGRNVEGEGENFPKTDEVHPGLATDVGPIEEDVSEEFAISDVAAYEPDIYEEEQPSARKRLFEDVSEEVGPSYVTICGEPLQKKRKGKGKKGCRAELVKLPSLLWPRFVPHREYEHQVESVFYHWYTASKNIQSKIPINLPTECLKSVTYDWFTKLYTAKGWLHDDHCDVLMNLLIIYSKAFPNDFLTDWTLIESIGTKTLALESMHDVSERILPYVEGEFPNQGGRPWHEVQYVHGICNTGEYHWVLYTIDLNEQMIVFYDSLSAKTKDWERVKLVMANIGVNVPRLVEMLDVDRSRDPKPVLRKVWPLMRYEHPPQQCNLLDCGVMCMKSLECLVTGKPFSSIVPERCVSYRRGYCAELFAHTMASRDV